MNISKLIGKKIAVHCDTEEKAKAFLKECEDAGVRWVSEREATSHTNWDTYKSDSCYDTYFNDNKIGYAGISWYKQRNYEILEYSFDKLTEQYHLEIKQKKNKVTAILKDDNGNYIRHVNAVCSPDDTFDYEIGKQIALSRLFPKLEVVREVKRQAEAGEYVKAVEPGAVPKDNGIDVYKKGDILKIIQGGSCSVFKEGMSEDGKCYFLFPYEYVVLENYKPEIEDKPLEVIINGVKYIKATN